MVTTSQPSGPSTAARPVRVQMLGLDGPVESLVRQAVERSGMHLASGDRRPNARFAPRTGVADVLVMGEPERAADLARTKLAAPSVRLIVIVGDATGSVTRRLLEAGADGVVAASTIRESLVPAVHAVMADLVCVPVSAREVTIAPALSIRERQVLALMAGGLSNAEIGERLYLTESTIKSHAASAFRRLGVRSRREAIALVLGSSETLRRSVLMSHPLEPPPHPGDDRRRSGG
jgi:DNA-binding NarL/FixJ family response regulator